MTVTHEEKTTLPEGATLSLTRCMRPRQDKTLMYYVQMLAYMNDKEVRMRVDNISPPNLPVYMRMMVKAIAHARSRLTSKPIGCHGTPETVEQFVNDMAFQDMFIFEALNPGEDTDANTNTTTKKVVQRRRKIQAHPSVVSDHHGTVHGSGASKTNRRRTK